jgi:hypothetical protein
MEEPDADREDRVEASVAEIDVLEIPDEELGLPGLDVRRIPARCRSDHRRRAIDRSKSTVIESLADERGGDAVPASDLEHSFTGPKAQ